MTQKSEMLWARNLGQGPEFSFMNEDWYIQLDGNKRAKILAEARAAGTTEVNGQAILEKVLGIKLENEDEVILDAIRSAAHRMGSESESLGATYGMVIAPYGGSVEGGVGAQLKKDIVETSGVSNLTADVTQSK